MTTKELEQEIQNKIQHQFTSNTYWLTNTRCYNYKFENYSISTDYCSLFKIELIDSGGWYHIICEKDLEYRNILLKINDDLENRRLGYNENSMEKRENVIKKFLGG